jgi:hypothetical protein
MEIRLALPTHRSSPSTSHHQLNHTTITPLRWSRSTLAVFSLLILSNLWFIWLYFGEENKLIELMQEFERFREHEHQRHHYSGGGARGGS